MKNIDVKSLIIGALLTSAIFLGVASTGPKDAWDAHQVWETGYGMKGKPGWIPCSEGGPPNRGRYLYRRRVK